MICVRSLAEAYIGFCCHTSGHLICACSFSFHLSCAAGVSISCAALRFVMLWIVKSDSFEIP